MAREVIDFPCSLMKLNAEDEHAIKTLSVPIPYNEANRLHVLKHSGLLDSNTSDPDFDRLTALTARILGAPMGFTTFMKSTRCWYKSKCGGTAEEMVDGDRSELYCAYTILPESPDVFVVLDSHDDPRFRDRFCGQHFRFYAGAAVFLDGIKVGTLCVVDANPRKEFSSVERANLLDLAAAVSDLVKKQRDLNIGLQRERSLILFDLSHNLRTPLTSLEMTINNMKDDVRDFDQQQLQQQQLYARQSFTTTPYNIYNNNSVSPINTMKTNNNDNNNSSIVNTTNIQPESESENNRSFSLINPTISHDRHDPPSHCDNITNHNNNNDAASTTYSNRNHVMNGSHPNNTHMINGNYYNNTMISNDDNQSYTSQTATSHSNSLVMKTHFDEADMAIRQLNMLIENSLSAIRMVTSADNGEDMKPEKCDIVTLIHEIEILASSIDSIEQRIFSWHYDILSKKIFNMDQYCYPEIIKFSMISILRQLYTQWEKIAIEFDYNLLEKNHAKIWSFHHIPNIEHGVLSVSIKLSSSPRHRRSKNNQICLTPRSHLHRDNTSRFRINMATAGGGGGGGVGHGSNHPSYHSLKSLAEQGEGGVGDDNINGSSSKQKNNTSNKGNSNSSNIQMNTGKPSSLMNSHNAATTTTRGGGGGDESCSEYSDSDDDTELTDTTQKYAADTSSINFSAVATVLQEINGAFDIIVSDPSKQNNNVMELQLLIPCGIKPNSNYMNVTNMNITMSSKLSVPPISDVYIPPSNNSTTATTTTTTNTMNGDRNNVNFDGLRINSNDLTERDFNTGRSQLTASLDQHPDDRMTPTTATSAISATGTGTGIGYNSNMKLNNNNSHDAPPPSITIFRHMPPVDTTVVPVSADPIQLSPRSRAPRVLLVEDSVPVQKAIARYLQKAGCEVKCCLNGRLGYHELKAASYDMVLCDFLMPVMSGPEMFSKRKTWIKEQKTLLVEEYKKDNKMDSGKDNISDRPSMVTMNSECTDHESDEDHLQPTSRSAVSSTIHTTSATTSNKSYYDCIPDVLNEHTLMVGISATASPDECSEAFRNGMHFFVAKPIAPDIMQVLVTACTMLLDQPTTTTATTTTTTTTTSGRDTMVLNSKLNEIQKCLTEDDHTTSSHIHVPKNEISDSEKILTPTPYMKLQQADAHIRNSSNCYEFAVDKCGAFKNGMIICCPK